MLGLWGHVFRMGRVNLTRKRIRCAVDLQLQPAMSGLHGVAPHTWVDVRRKLGWLEKSDKLLKPGV